MTNQFLGLCVVVFGALPAMAQLETNLGDVTVTVSYQGQPIPRCFGISLVADGLSNFQCGQVRTGLPPGNYTLREFTHPTVTPVPFVIVAGQMTTVNVEMSPYIGEITGLMEVNGAIPPVGSITAFASYPQLVNNSSTDATGRFRFLAWEGAGTGVANTATFPINTVANSTVDVGTIVIATSTGNVTVTTAYKGQPIAGCMGVVLYADGIGSFQCGRTQSDLPPGSYQLREFNHPSIPPIPFTVVAGQTTTLHVDLSPYLGEVTGLVLVNGAVPAAGSVTAFANYPQLVNNGATDATGRFRFLAFAGPGTGTANEASFPYNAVADATVDVGTVAIGRDTGFVTVRVLYQGSPIVNCIGIHLETESAGGIAGFQCGRVAAEMPAGDYFLREHNHSDIPEFPFTVVTGQTTVVDVEMSPYIGEITGTLLINGVPPAPFTVVASANHPALVNTSTTDTTGRFRFLAFAGPGTGRAGVVPFAFNAVAGETRDIGGIGTVSLNSAIAGKSGVLPARTWRVQISNTGTTTLALGAQLDSMTFTQTFGTACAPTLGGTFPKLIGDLLPGTNGEVSVGVNFGGCPLNARFSVKLTYSANGGAATGTKTISNQLQ